MIFSIFLIKKSYRFIVGMAFFGSVFPDLIDLSPQIFNNYLGFNFPELDKFFPFHQHEFSGSIYDGNCRNSIAYQILTVLSIIVICFINRRKFRSLFTS
jgi:hypothetical protein